MPGEKVVYVGLEEKGNKRKGGGREEAQAPLCSAASLVSSLSSQSPFPDLLPPETFLFMMVVTHAAVAFLFLAATHSFRSIPQDAVAHVASACKTANSSRMASTFLLQP